jgi:hypothetical protein
VSRVLCRITLAYAAGGCRQTKRVAVVHSTCMVLSANEESGTAVNIHLLRSPLAVLAEAQKAARRGERRIYGQMFGQITDWLIECARFSPLSGGSNRLR